MKTFKTRVRARYCETDAAEVIYYGSYMHYFEVGKMEMFRELGIPYRRDIPITETYCRYPAPARFDDLLEIRTRFDDIREKLAARGVPPEEIADIHDYKTIIRIGDIRIASCDCNAGGA